MYILYVYIYIYIHISCINWGNSNNSNYSYNIIYVMLYPLGSQIFFGKRAPSYCRILQYIAILISSCWWDVIAQNVTEFNRKQCCSCTDLTSNLVGGCWWSQLGPSSLNSNSMESQWLHLTSSKLGLRSTPRISICSCLNRSKIFSDMGNINLGAITPWAVELGVSHFNWQQVVPLVI